MLKIRKYISDFSCCLVPKEEGGLVQCLPLDDSDKCADVKSAGVAPSTYKQYCRPGYLWVEWKKICLRKE